MNEAILTEIRNERDAQDKKWGEQNHPDGTGHTFFRREADIARGECNARAADGRLTWADILLEEVYEALAERDPARLREELKQTAAVCVNWIEKIDREIARAPRLAV